MSGNTVAMKNLKSGIITFISKCPMWGYALIFLLLIFSRCPPYLIHPAFWGEDGLLWYADAYRIGLECLSLPANGYLQTVSRLTASLAVHFPLVWAPAIFVWVGMIFQLLPALFILSERMGDAITSKPLRMLIAFIYVSIPNADEVFLNLTNVQWHLAILAFLILFSRTPKRVTGWIFDCAMLLLCGLSGPFSLLLSPIALLEWWRKRSVAVSVRTLTISLTALTQALYLVNTITQTRSHAHLGASYESLVQIMMSQVFLGGTLGRHIVEKIYGAPSFPLLSLIFFPIGITLLVASLIDGSRIYKMFLCFAGMILIAALAAPQVTLTGFQWSAMIPPGGGGRYFVIPILAWLMALLTLVRSKYKPVKLAAIGLLGCLVIGGISDWSYQPFKVNNFHQLAVEFDQSPVETTMTFPINPEGWSFTLTKR